MHRRQTALVKKDLLAKSTTGHVVLVGMMGSGKTTVGRRLANLLDRPFVDTDEMLVSSTGKEIATWFSEAGEEAFRDVEQATVTEALRKTEPHVIATGGGVILRAETRRSLCDPTHLVVWLRASPKFLAGRIEQKGSRGDRPLLRDDPATKLAQLDDARRDHYAQVADMIIDIAPVMRAAEKPKRAIAQLIADTLALEVTK